MARNPGTSVSKPLLRHSRDLFTGISNIYSASPDPIPAGFLLSDRGWGVVQGFDSMLLFGRLVILFGAGYNPGVVFGQSDLVSCHSKKRRFYGTNKR